ncbi:MAG: hypothetical protein ACK4E0_07910 [Chitinophagaceae bacterium]
MRYLLLCLLIPIACVLTSCNEIVVTTTLTDAGTGMTTEYQKLKPARSFVVMNGERLQHNDIPIGESFQIINDNVTGLTEKNGKVSIGCSLLIKEQNGKVLLDRADIFEGKDQLDPAEAKQLRCSIFTGEPMKWEELYEVKVVFWDKFGTGKITNTLTIRAIDIP